MSFSYFVSVSLVTLTAVAVLAMVSAGTIGEGWIFGIIIMVTFEALALLGTRQQKQTKGQKDDSKNQKD